MTQKEKPPIGVAPAWLVAWKRIGELAAAIERQYQSENGDPKLVEEWANEISWQAAMIEAIGYGGAENE